MPYVATCIPRADTLDMEFLGKMDNFLKQYQTSISGIKVVSPRRVIEYELRLIIDDLLKEKPDIDIRAEHGIGDYHDEDHDPCGHSHHTSHHQHRDMQAVKKIDENDPEDKALWDMAPIADPLEALRLMAARLQRKALPFGDENAVDILIQNDRQKYRKGSVGLVVFDMDSTLIEQEVIELIAKYAGVEDQVRDITTRAMNGELDFKQSLYARVKLLAGVTGDCFEELKPQLKFTNGARELVKVLHKYGVKTAVLSGGFLPLALHVQKELGLDYAFANTLEVDSATNKLTGRVVGDIVDGARKAQLLEEIAGREKVPLESVVAVGDGANDLPMMKKAGFGVAWNAKPTVQAQAPSRVNSNTLKDVLYILGWNDAEIDEALGEERK